MEGKFLLNFTAIDFETATRYKNSACSVAVVDIENGKIVDKLHADSSSAYGVRFMQHNDSSHYA